MWFVTWVGGMALTLIAGQAFTAILWAVSSTMTGEEFTDNVKVALHSGMAVITMVMYLFVSGGLVVFTTGG